VSHPKKVAGASSASSIDPPVRSSTDAPSPKPSCRRRAYLPDGLRLVDDPAETGAAPIRKLAQVREAGA
jgi:hypothetical protein